MRLECPTRTRAHWLADLSLNYAERFFLLQGHTLQRIYNDYGYDAEIKTFNYGDDTARLAGTVEPGAINLQLKATERLNVLADGETIAYPVLWRHLAMWQEETMPVILIVYDVTAERAYWLDVQSYLLDNNTNLETEQNEITLRLPMQNVLDEAAVETIRQSKNNEAQVRNRRKRRHE